ncbi:hypothetical protein PROVRETT_09092 [Providencia rettgeri DSM 1131]|nr:hypothetical protein PROVRETT_09092 [Providencia rettgeri DSM 1131]
MQGLYDFGRKETTDAYFYILSPIIVVISRNKTTKEQNSNEFHSS